MFLFVFRAARSGDDATPKQQLHNHFGDTG
jgi:hypothetical protein